MDALTRQGLLIDRIARALGADGSAVDEFETHISRVLVAGDYAFKFKKALRLPFLDFSTLAARRRCCEAECRLNRRLAPRIYIDVLPVAGSAAHPVLGGAGEAIEYAVRMHAFDQRELWCSRLAHGQLDKRDMDALAQVLARFHLHAPSAPAGTDWGTMESVAAMFSATVVELGALVLPGAAAARFPALRDWEARARARLAPAFRHRHAQGFIREGHGDLHCENIVTLRGEVQAFDCIEFSDALRWIDVMCDVAFIHMDLAFHGRPDLAALLLSRYLEVTGDYAGLAVLPYYRVDRALVRAKVMLLRGHQAAFAYVAFAQRCSRTRQRVLMITHGYSGSGKTHFSRCVVQLLGAVQLRSDVERQRLYRGLYGDAATRHLYAHLRKLAATVVEAGWPVIVDAACLMAWQRESFRALAADMDIPFFLFDVRASHAVMRERVRSRQHSGEDASDASDADDGVLAHQLATGEPLTRAENLQALRVDTESGLTTKQVRRACAPVLSMLRAVARAARSG